MNPVTSFGGLSLFMAVAILTPSRGVEPDEVVAVIVKPGSVSLRVQEVMLLYRRKKLFLRNSDKANPVNLPASSPLRGLFSQVILGAPPEDLEKYWNYMYFQGVSPPFVLSSEEAVMRFVSTTPGAIGYVSYCNVDLRVKVALVFTATGLISEGAARAICLRLDNRAKPAEHGAPRT